MKQGAKAGYPRFQGRNGFDSFQYPQVWRDEKWTGGGKPVDGGRKVYLPKIGDVRLKMHRALEGTPKTLTVKREGAVLYAIYACEVADTPLPATGSTIGFDLGTNPNFLITSDGGFVRQRKARKQVARIHRKTANQLESRTKVSEGQKGR